MSRRASTCGSAVGGAAEGIIGGLLVAILGGFLATRIGDRVVNQLEPAERDIAMVFQNYALYPHLTVAENIAESAAEATIRTASITTGNDDRDAHVKNEDFFAVEQYPEITFKATNLNVDENGNGTVTGDLTIKGTTKSVDLDVEDVATAEDPFGNTRLGFEATTKINRKDFGIDFNAPLKTGGVLVSEEIKIELEVSAIKQ